MTQDHHPPERHPARSPGRTVRQLAFLTGVSVRTLHHYDAIGLLRPGHVGSNGYRYYGRAELLRLQQILLHRRLGLSLTDIARILDAPGFDQAAALAGQHARLIAERARLETIIATIERTLRSLKGNGSMTDADLYSGIISPEKQADYERWIVERHGDEGEAWIAEARRRPAPGTDARAESMARLKAVETALADHLRAGTPADSPLLDVAVAAHRDWVASSWGRSCPPMAYANLADMYAHPDFKARYEALAPGLAEYLPAAMRAWAARQSE